MMAWQSVLAQLAKENHKLLHVAASIHQAIHIVLAFSHILFKAYSFYDALSAFSSPNRNGLPWR